MVDPKVIVLPLSFYSLYSELERSTIIAYMGSIVAWNRVWLKSSCMLLFDEAMVTTLIHSTWKAIDLCNNWDKSWRSCMTSITRFKDLVKNIGASAGHGL